MFQFAHRFISKYDGDISDEMKSLEGRNAVMAMSYDVLEAYRDWLCDLTIYLNGKDPESLYFGAYPDVPLSCIHGRFDARTLSTREGEVVDKFFDDSIRDRKRLGISHISTYVCNVSWSERIDGLKHVAKILPDDVRFTVRIDCWSDNGEMEGSDDPLWKFIDTLHGRNLKIECDEVNTDEIMGEVQRINTLFEPYVIKDHGHHVAKVFYANANGQAVDEEFHVKYFGESVKSRMYRWEAGYEPLSILFSENDMDPKYSHWATV